MVGVGVSIYNELTSIEDKEAMVCAIREEKQARQAKNQEIEDVVLLAEHLKVPLQFVESVLLLLDQYEMLSDEEIVELMK